jgi:hypothetical protein
MLVRDNPLQTRKFHDQERGTPPVSIDGRCAEDKEIAAKSPPADAEIGSRVNCQTVSKIIMTGS